MAANERIECHGLVLGAPRAREKRRRLCLAQVAHVDDLGTRERAKAPDGVELVGRREDEDEAAAAQVGEFLRKVEQGLELLDLEALSHLHHEYGLGTRLACRQDQASDFRNRTRLGQLQFGEAGKHERGCTHLNVQAQKASQHHSGSVPLVTHAP